MEENFLSVVEYFVNKLGYNENQFHAEYSFPDLIDEVKLPKSLSPQKGRVVFDLVVFFCNRPKVVIEKKGQVFMSKFFKKNDTGSEQLKEQIIECIQQRIQYYILTDGKNYLCYDISKIKKKSSLVNGDASEVFKKLDKYKLKKWEEELQAQNVADSLSFIHENIFSFLHKKHEENSNFLFTLRKVNRAKRLDKGYYFIGNESYLATSFWTGSDNHNKTPNIYIEIENKNSFVLRLTCKDDDKKIELLDRIASLVGAYRVKKKGEYINHWYKYYYKDDYSIDYLETLQEFLKKDKQIIDLIIKSDESKAYDIGDLDKEDFDKTLKRILKVRKKFLQKAIKEAFTPTTDKSNYPIVLKKLRLKNIGLFKHLTLDLNARVICILGENGIGKTSILRAIALGLVGINESDEIDANATVLQRMLHIQGQDKGVIQYTAFGSIELDYSLEQEYSNKITFNSAVHPSNIVVLDDDVVLDSKKNDKPSFGAITNGEFNHLVIGFTQERGTNDVAESDKNRLLEATVQDVKDLILGTPSNRLMKLKDWIIDLDSDASKESDNDVKREGKRVVLNTLFDIISTVTEKPIRLAYSEATSNTLWVKRENDPPILFELISQGYQNVFSWIGYFIMRLAEVNDYSEDFLDKPAIVIIDEIDTYLHPKWQRNILNILVEKFRNTKFIITTHSPLVLSYLKGLKPEEQILYILEEIEEPLKEGEEPEKINNMYGRDIKAIFNDWMGIPERDSDLTDKLNEIRELIRKGDEDSLNKAKEELELLQLSSLDEVFVQLKNRLADAWEDLLDDEE